MKQALWQNRYLLLLAIVLLVFALWLSVKPVQAQGGGYCTFGYVRYWQDGYYITEGRWYCTGWQTPRRVEWRR
ncbi:MAG: hypothetical protein PVJ86_12205 [Phycisphaerales bacterium]|jgi:hypothetical protein